MGVRKIELRNGVAMVGAAWVSFFIASLLWSPLVLLSVDEVMTEPRGVLSMGVRVTLGVIGGGLAGLLFGYVLESRRRLVWCLALGAYTAWLFTRTTRIHPGPSNFGSMLNLWPGIAAGLAAISTFSLGQRWQGGSHD
jgi:hypothetical protein